MWSSFDRSFLEHISGDSRGPHFVNAAVALAHAGRMSVVVEGIETRSHLDIANAVGADLLQGYLLARPLSAEAAGEVLLHCR